MKDIARILLNVNVRPVLLKKGYRLELHEGVVEYLGREGYDPIRGARPLKGKVASLVEDPLIDFIQND